MIRSLGVAFVVFLALFLAGFGVVALTTRDTDILAPRYLDQAQQLVGAAIDGLPGAEGQALDAGGDPDQGTANQSNQLETFRLQARNNLNLWLGAVMIGGLVVSWSWLFHAFGKAAKVVGPESARGAAPLWWGGLITGGAIVAGATLFILRSRGLAGLVTGSVVNMGLMLSFGLVLIAYYLATAIGAPPVVRPSVPLATLWLR